MSLYQLIENTTVTREDVDILVERMAGVFDGAQKNAAAHRKLAVTLQRLYETAIELDVDRLFAVIFIGMINRILPIRRSDLSADRIVKFCDMFFGIMIRALDYSAENEEDDDEIHQDNGGARFLEGLVIHLLKGINAKDKSVRYRSCELIAVALNHMQAVEDEMLNKLKSGLGRRIHDKEASVRLQAILALLRLQGIDEPEGRQPSHRESHGRQNGHGSRRRTGVDGNSNNSGGSSIATSANSKTIEEMLVEAMRDDPSAEVRRAILLNLEWSPINYPALLERACDTDARTRRGVYTRRMKDIGGGDFRQLKIGEREKLLEWGLKDRDAHVRSSATKMLVDQWLPTVDNSLIVLLEKLDVTQSTIAGDVLQSLFEAKGESIMDKIAFPDDFWQTLTAESVFFAKEFNEFCRKIAKKTKNDDEDPFFLPELKRLGGTLERYFLLLQSTKGEAEIEFILNQLLAIAETYDFSDEMGRRTIMMVVRQFITSIYLTDRLLEKCAKILRLLSIHERDFAQLMAELVAEMADVTENAIDVENEEEEDDDDEDDISKIGTPTARVVKRRRDSSDSYKDEYPGISASGSSDLEQIDPAMNLRRCLLLAQHTLEVIEGPLEENTPVMHLIESLVVPAINHDGFPDAIRIATRCLGLCSVLSVSMAKKYMMLFAQAFYQVDSENEDILLKEESVKIIADIMVTHGIAVLEDTELREKRIIKILATALRDYDTRSLQAIAGQALCKLILGGVSIENDIVKVLIMEYFSPNNTRNGRLLQILSFCLPVYSYSSRANQKRMAECLLDSVRRLCSLYDDQSADGEMVLPTQVIYQLIDWTDPQKVVGPEKDDDLTGVTTHVNLAEEIINRIRESESRTELKALCGGLSKLNLSNVTKPDAIKMLQDVDDNVVKLTSIRKFVGEAGLRNNLNRFHTMLSKIINHAETLNAEEPHENEAEPQQEGYQQEEQDEQEQESQALREDQIHEDDAEPELAYDSD